MRALKEEEREQEGEKGRRQGSNYKVLNRCSACPEFPSITNGGEDSRDRKEQAERRGLPHSLRLDSVAGGPFVSVHHGAGKWERVTGSSEEDQRQGEWQH